MFRALIVTSLLLACLAGVLFRDQLFPPTKAELSSTPQPERYAAMVADLGAFRADLASRYSSASAREKDSIVAESRQLLNLVLPEMMRCWLGTPWDFNGTAEAPGGGEIACGYYVATVLRDAGFDIDRVPLAQSPSELILRTFVTSSQETTKRIGTTFPLFLQEIGAQPPGIYIVGLDTHVGFVVHDGSSDLRFIHASGTRPWCVVDQAAKEASVLKSSRYKVWGNVTAQEEVVQKWLTMKTFAIAAN